ncbi:MAG TPA: hypothetical protein VFJ02_01495 [Vicinamibacterales bacterium]|nr:hypothetical protein [Vicinamibacterales bacterium]
MQRRTCGAELHVVLTLDDAMAARQLFADTPAFDEAMPRALRRVVM